jgi:hypothetical protein
MTKKKEKIERIIIPTDHKVKSFNFFTGEDKTNELTLQTFHDIRSLHPKYKHAIFSQNALIVGKKCFDKKGKCYGCGRINL